MPEEKQKERNPVVVSKKKGIRAYMTKRKDGRYMARFKKADGTTKYVYGKTKQECLNNLNKALKEYDEEENALFITKDSTLAFCIDYYLENFANLKATTLKLYESTIDLVKKSDLGNTKIGDIKFPIMKKFIENINYPTTKQRALAMLNNVYSKLLEIGIIKTNIIALIPKDKKDKEDIETAIKKGSSAEKHRYYSDDEKTAVVEGIKSKNHDIGCLVEFLFATGLRVGEALGLTWDNVDFEKKDIFVCQQLTRGILTTPKSKKSIRHVPMFADAQIAINSLINRDGKFVFKQRRNSIYYYLGDFCFHSARHTFITNCYLAGIDTKVVQEWVGHESSQITNNVYTHATKENAAKSIEILNNFKK